jgi:predicted ATPase/DNA-binding SARP family transcriptional activator
LGTFQATLDGEPIAGFESAKVRALLAYLIVESGAPQRRETLAGLLWPERAERAARNNLRHALSVLRTAIGDRNAAHTERGTPPFLLITRETIQFNRTGDVWLDVEAFRTLVEVRSESHTPCRHLEEAVAIYRGSFLEGFSVKGSPAFEEWSLLVRDRLQRQASMALLRLVRVYEARGEVARACRYARRQIELEPWHEEAHRRLMRLLALNGQRSAALVQYEACCRALRDELDVEPGVETVRLYERIRDGELTPGTAPSTPSSLSTGDPALSHAATRKATRQQRERRTVTALAALVVISTTQGDPIDVETRVEVVGHVCRVLSHEIEGYGGEVDRYRDDGLVALFGASVAHEDDPERAVLAALGIEQALQRDATGLVQGPVALSLRVGIHTGEVIAAPIGNRAQYWDASATNPALTLAAEGAPSAEIPVTIWVAEETWSLVAALFEWERVDGTGSVPTAYRPLERRLIQGKGRGVEGLTSPLVGREVEFQALRAAVTRLQSGVGGIMTLVGEAGIGKSRLMAEVKRAALQPSLPLEPANLKWIEGRCLSYATNVAYQLWLDVLRTFLMEMNVPPDALPTAVRDALRKQVRLLCPGCADEVYPYLGRMLALPLEEETEAVVRRLDAESLQFVTFRAVETLLERAATQYPLVVVCEDLHWADPTSLALLGRLLPLVDRARLLFVCLFRPEIERGCWALRGAAIQNYPHCHTDLWLKPLTTTESAALIGNLLHVDDTPRALRTRILERAEGNPFYVEEILRALIADGTLVHDDVCGHWDAARAASDLPIPDTLHGVIAARIDRLSGEAKHVLQVASVIGRIFSYPVLAAVVRVSPLPVEEGLRPSAIGGVRALDAQLLTLQRAQLIHERARLPTREYAFKHVLTQEATYGGLLKRERRAIHRRVAKALEQIYPEHIEEQLGLLAYHWEQAGEAREAVEYLRRASAQAVAQYANDEAIGYLSRAIELTPKDDLDRRYVLLLAREGVYNVQGARKAQHQDLAALEALAEALGDDERRAQVALCKAQYAYVVSDCATSIAAAQQAVALAQAAGDVARETAAHLQWGITLRRMNDHAAAALRLERALVLARRALLHDLEADALRALGFVRGFQGEWTLAETYLQQALALCRQAADVETEGRVLVHLGMGHAVEGDYVMARSYSKEALRISEKIGFRWGQGEAIWCLGYISLCLGDYARAESLLVRGLEIGRETRNPGRESRTLADLGLIAHCRGDHEGAQAYSRRGLAVAERCGNQWYQAYALTVLGHALAGLERYAEGVDVYRRALTLYRNMRLPNCSFDVLAGLARSSLVRGEHAEALDYVQGILRYIRLHPNLQQIWEPLRVCLTCYDVLREVDDSRSEEVLEEAYRLLQERAGTIKDERLRRSYLKNIPHHREIIALWKKQDRLSASRAEC